MGVDLYPPIVHEGDIPPDSIGDEIDAACEEIKAACEGWGTDEGRLIKALGSQNQEARCKISVRYKQLYGEDLVDVLKSECGSRDFGTALQLLAVPPDIAECMIINRACSGAGTNEKVLYPIICGRSNKEMELLKRQFFQKYEKDLATTLSRELGGDFEQVIINCLQGAEEEYDPEYHNEEKMNEDIRKLYEMGEGKIGTDEVGVFKILCASPHEYLQELNLKYADKHGYTLLKTMEKEMSGDAGKAGLFLLGMKLKPSETVAKLIEEACAGFGTNEFLLSSCLIRYQGIMKEIMLSHIDLYDMTLAERIKDETRNDYEDLLVAILEAADQA